MILYRIVTRWLPRMLIALVLLLLLLVSFVVFLITTETGLKQVVNYAPRWLPGELKIAQATGSLTNDMTLSGVEYQWDAVRFRTDRLRLHWQPLAFMDDLLYIKALELENSTLQLPASEEPEDDKPIFPIQLPAIELPLKLQLDQLLVSTLRFSQITAEGVLSQPVVIDALALSAYTKKQQLVIDQLDLKAPQGQVALKGEITLVDNYPLMLSTQWRFNLGDQPALEGQGRIEGDLDSLLLKQQLSGLLHVTLDGKVGAILTAPEFMLDAKKIDVDLGIADKTRAGQHITGDLTIKGDLNQAKLQGSLLSRLPELGESQLTLLLDATQQEIRLQQLQLTQADAGADLILSGLITQFQSGNPTFDLQGQWKKLGYPLVGEADYASPSGSLHFSGELQKYQISLQAALEGKQIPKGEWRLTGQGTDKALQTFELSGKALEGTLNLQGQAQWLPQVTWDVQLNAENVNPGAHWAEWPGKLALSLKSQGLLDAKHGPDLTAEIAQLRGSLRDQQVSGTGSLSFKKSELTVNSLSVIMGGAQLAASGQVGKQLNLDWLLDAPSLVKLLPNAKGSVKGQGTLRGTQEKPQLVGKLEGSGVQWDVNKVASLKADFDLDVSGGKTSHILVDATSLQLAAERWERLVLKGDGVPNQHRIDLALTGGPVAAELSAQGGVKQNQWQGRLSQLSLENEIAGRWQLKAPVQIEAAADQFSITPLCLLRQPASTGELCAQVSQTTKKGVVGSAQLTALPVALLEPFMTVSGQLEGVMNSSLEFSQKTGAKPTFSAQGTLNSGAILLEDDGLSVRAGSIQFNAQSQGDGLVADFNLPFISPVGSINANLVVKSLYSQPKLNGKALISLDDLAFVSVLSPSVQEVKGQVKGELTLVGSAANPIIQGYLSVEDASAELPATGIKVEKITLSVRDQADSTALNIMGSAESAGGTLHLKGSFDPPKKAGQLNLSGQHFQAAATDEIKAWISPDLDLTIQPNLVNLSGEIIIPEAAISPPKQTGVVTASDDAQIVAGGQSQDMAATKQKVITDVRITLGDKVSVDALGFKGSLLGSVRIEDDGSRATRATGSMKVAAGQYRIYGQDLNIERGSVIFSGGPVDNPGLDMRVTRVVEDVTAGAQISGTVSEPVLTLFSTPSMPESSLLSYLLFGRAPGAGSGASEQQLLMRAAAAMTMKGGNAIGEKLSDTFNLDSIGLEGDSVQDTGIYIGKYLSPKLYVKYGMGLMEPTSTFFMRYILSKRWSIESLSSASASGGDILYTLEH